MNLHSARTILVADDDAHVLAFVARVLGQAGYDVTTVENGDAAIALLKAGRFDLLLSDIHMPGADGFQLLDSALELGAIGAAVLMTGQGSIALAVRAIRQGARDFITKPVDAAQLAAVVDRVLGTPIASDDDLDARRFRDLHAPEVVGDHPSLLDVFGLLERVADTDCNVVVSGESGTGKELIARAIHQASERRNGPFVTVNCAAIPAELMESEIFGHAKGAFTGATERRIGKFEAADGGTLFLDEIGEMELALQSKLLRVLQDRVFTPVGEHRSRTADVRIVTATNRDLESEADVGAFRLDLFHRLNVIPIELPALRERASDIESLVNHFVRSTATRYRRPVVGIATDALRMLESYNWPGNVRELRNLIERLIVLKKDDTPIAANDLPSTFQQVRISQAFTNLRLPEEGIDLRGTLEKIEYQLTVDALERSNGNKARAADLLGLKRTTLLERIKRLNLLEIS